MENIENPIRNKIIECFDVRLNLDYSYLEIQHRYKPCTYYIHPNVLLPIYLIPHTKYIIARKTKSVDEKNHILRMKRVSVVRCVEAK